MPRAKKQKDEKNKSSQKGKKGGQASRNKKQDQDMGDTPEYFEVDEFTLDDIPSSRS